jgi:hypothetical protein
MAENRKRYVGREFMGRLRMARAREGTTRPEIASFIASPADMRLEVALGLVGIGADGSEKPMQRIFALQVLATIIGLGGLQGSQALEVGLESIIGDLVSGPPAGQPEGGREIADKFGVLKTALVAFLAVNRPLARERLSGLAVRYRQSQFGRELREMLRRQADQG